MMEVDPLYNPPILLIAYSVPTGMKASSGYTDGVWDTDPADTTITGAQTFTYTFTAKPAS